MDFKHKDFYDDKDWIRNKIKERQEEINAFQKVEEHEFSAWYFGGLCRPVWFDGP